ncbi:MAG: hypothetical protein HOW73_21405 [Polyangiaceae bacterium]|nr:hypothetical protein [Polyangiaceae bacterium]
MTHPVQAARQFPFGKAPVLIGHWLIGAALLVACGDDSAQGAGNQGGGNDGGSANGGNVPDGGAGAGGETAGGGGSGPFSCADCVAPTDICVDDASCADTCPDQREACNTSVEAGAPQVCCAADEQCCTAAVNGYSGADVCAPAGGGCPVECPGGDLVCPSGNYCELDAETSTYSCATECNPLYICGNNCCPLGSTCGPDDSCVLADLTIDLEQAASSVEIDQYNFQQGSCSFFEGCIGAIGQRRLLRFDLRTPNIGDGDMFLGDPTGNPLFIYSTCHEHFHFEGYARYRLLDGNGNEVATGHKQAFCLMDVEPFEPGAPDQQKYDCGYQGIQKGWADTYHNQLPCQWVDITDVPAGEYMLEISLNADHTLGEKDYTNNLAVVPVTVTD